MADSYDVIVIGGGPGGYVAAIRAAQNGLKVACIDNWINRDGSRSFGGTCLNAGCIPSKALLESSELYHRAQEEFSSHGIGVGKLSLDLATMQKRKAGIVGQLTGGIQALFKSNKVTGLQGQGKLLAGRKVEYTDVKGKVSVLDAKNVIIATGSSPIELQQVPFDGNQVVDSWGALDFTEVPKRLGVIGGGVIGLELGSVWKRLGAEVVVLEAMDDFLFMADRAVAKEVQRLFKRQGLEVRTGAKVTGSKVLKKGVTLNYDDAKGSQSIEVDKVVVAVGRKANTEGLLGEDSGVQLDERGRVVVDDNCRTGVDGIWAVGDVVRGAMLAHKASEEGVVVADLIAGKVAEMNYAVIPSVIYTAPEIAWVGLTEEQVKESGRAYKIGTFSFAANGRAKAMEAAAGLVKVIAAEDTDELLGVHIVGPMAGELIGEAVVAMEFQGSAEDLQLTIHAHPSLSEAIHEAALAVDKRAIHAINR